MVTDPKMFREAESISSLKAVFVLLTIIKDPVTSS
jgi:hypothetical protein